jgi:uncharacterized protein (UPF0276 family)
MPVKSTVSSLLLAEAVKTALASMAAHSTSVNRATYFNDLLPLPYTEATLSQVSDHIDEVQ